MLVVPAGSCVVRIHRLARLVALRHKHEPVLSSDDRALPLCSLQAGYAPLEVCPNFSVNRVPVVASVLVFEHHFSGVDPLLQQVSQTL